MAEENPPSDAPASAGIPKKETVRITLPPKPSQSPDAKRETVRIQPPGASPKSDSASLPGLGSVPPAAPKPFVPPPSPPKPPGIPSAPARPAMSTPAPGGMPKAPGAPLAPPARPAPPAGAPPSSATYAETAPVTMKAMAPKKETARITLPPESKPMPKATIKMQQTQPLAQAPAPALRAAALTPMGAATSDGADPIVGILCWVVLAASIVSAAMSYLAFAA